MDESTAPGFPERLRQAMKDAHFTQEELARRLSISRPLVGHWSSGQRTPDIDAIGRLARELRVDKRWLQKGPTLEDAPVEVCWQFPGPIAGQRDYGNANVWTVPADISTEVREAGQNSRDAGDGKSKAVIMRFKVIELHGAEVNAFWQAAGWSSLREHIAQAAMAKGKLARKLGAGLERIEDNPDRLLLLRIDDFGTTGLEGDEVGSGAFAALVRNNLDSDKQSTSAGGSFGLGKAAHWRCSDISTVFFNTVTPTHAARVIARAELTYHELESQAFAGPGWFGQRGDKQYIESVADASLAARLHLERDPLPDELRSWVTSDYGTSILVVGFQNPASEEPNDPAALIEEIERELAINFWPAIRRGRFIAIVQHEVAGHVSATRVVDPRRLVPDYCDIVDKFVAGDTADAFEREGDVVCVSVPLRLPRCKHDASDVLKHTAMEAEAKLIIALADPDELTDAALSRLSPVDAAKARIRRSLLNSVAFVRGPLMVTQYARKEGILVGARPFHAVLLAGEAAGSAPHNRYVEQFLRAAEPPAHDKWMFTDDLRGMYERGAKTRLEDFLGKDLAAALRRVLRVPPREGADGPDELKKLLNLGDGPGDPPRDTNAVLRNVLPSFKNDRWTIKADVLIRKRDRVLHVEPYVAMNVESGRPLRVRWEQLELVQGPGVQLLDGSFVVDGTGARFTFKGVTEAADVPVDPRRCSARVALVVKEHQR